MLSGIFIFMRVCHVVKYILQRAMSQKKPVSSPQLPRNEPLQRRVTLVHEAAASRPTERQGFSEYQRLTIVKYIAFAIVGRR